MIDQHLEVNPHQAVLGGSASPTAPDRRQLAVALFRLALGRPVGDSAGVDWGSLLRLAVEERCAPLAWQRSGAAIRRFAPPAISAEWRAFAVECHAHGLRQLRTLGEVVNALTAAGIAPIVLKGLPLAERLYGVSTVRGSADLDLFVHEASRSGAERVLGELGWSPFEGVAPWTQTLVASAGDRQLFLELHSSLLDMNLMHLGAPPPLAETVTIDGIALPVHRDVLVPAYLASHAAKHMPIALLYHIDFWTLWGSLSEAERAEAAAAAARVGLAAYLRWAIRHGQCVELAADGDLHALRRLGIGSNGRTVYHAVFRDIALAQTPLDAGRSVAAWLWPPHLRGGLGPLARRWAARMRKPWREYVVRTHGPGTQRRV